MDLLDRGTSWLHRRLEESAASYVKYERPGEGSVRVLAVRGLRNEVAESATGVEIWLKREDWIIRCDRLVIAFKQIEPRVGDRVIVPVNSGSETYEVTSIDDGEPPYRKSDRYHNSYRIHSHRISIGM